MKEVITKILFSLLTLFLIIFELLFVFIVTVSISTFSLGWIFKNWATIKEDEAILGIEIAAFSIFLGFVFALLGLVPSYKITLSLAKFFEKRGWKIEKPGRLFFFSLLLLLGIFFLLFYLH